jgi:7-carboxy-7-deazaguanine synthase
MRVFEIFQSIDGEVNAWGQGIPSTFIRLAGCNKSCSYCDIPEAQDIMSGTEMSVDEVVDNIRLSDCPKVTITGGEPLLQEDAVHELLNRLFPLNYKISIETNGSISTHRFRKLRKPNPNVCLVVDYKINSSVSLHAFDCLREWDWVKIVVGGQDDFDYARGIFTELRDLGCKARFALSPVHGVLSGKLLAGWMLDAKLWDITLNCQIHKFLDLR